MICSELRSPNIVTMYGFCTKGEQLCLVTEFVEGGNLATYIAGKSTFDPVKVALAITSGMRYLHKMKIIHNDLKVIDYCPYLMFII